VSIVKSITDYINKNLELSIFKGSNASLYSITEHVAKDDKMIPAIIKDGEADYVIYDDRFDFVVYHRLENIGYTLVKSSGYGDSVNNKQAVYNMALYVSFNSDKIAAHELIEAINTAFVTNLTSAQNQKLSLLSATIETTGAVAQSKENNLLNSEFQISGNEILPKITMARIRYTITTTARLACVNPCNTEEKCLN